VKECLRCPSLVTDTKHLKHIKDIIDEEVYNPIPDLNIPPQLIHPMADENIMGQFTYYETTNCCS